MRYLERKIYQNQCKTFKKTKQVELNKEKTKKRTTQKKLQKFSLEYICKSNSDLDIFMIKKLAKVRLWGSPDELLNNDLK